MCIGKRTIDECKALSLALNPNRIIPQTMRFRDAHCQCSKLIFVKLAALVYKNVNKEKFELLLFPRI